MLLSFFAYYYYVKLSFICYHTSVIFFYLQSYAIVYCENKKCLCRLCE